MPKCKFILKKKQFRILVVFPPIFVVETKVIYGYNFVAPLMNETLAKVTWRVGKAVSRANCFNKIGRHPM